MKILEALRDEVLKNISDFTFGILLQELRMALGLKQIKIAEITGIGINRLKNLEIERFKYFPKVHEIEALSQFYEIPTDIFYDLISKMKKTRPSKSYVLRCQNAIEKGKVQKSCEQEYKNNDGRGETPAPGGGYCS